MGACSNMMHTGNNRDIEKQPCGVFVAGVERGYRSQARQIHKHKRGGFRQNVVAIIFPGYTISSNIYIYNIPNNFLNIPIIPTLLLCISALISLIHRHHSNPARGPAQLRLQIATTSL